MCAQGTSNARHGAKLAGQKTRKHNPIAGENCITASSHVSAALD
jgi:hypothetical protein